MKTDALQNVKPASERICPEMIKETTNYSTELTAAEARYFRASLSSLLSEKNSSSSACLHFVTALAVEAGLTFREICDLTLNCFNFQSQLIFLHPTEPEDIPRAVRMDIETRIGFGRWMTQRAVPEDGIDGLLLHKPINVTCPVDLFNTEADPITPDDIIQDYRKLLFDLNPEHPHAARMSRFVESDLASYYF